MIYKTLTLFALVTLFAAILPVSSYADEIYTEVTLTIKDEQIFAFSSYKSHWVPLDIRLAERVVEKKSQGNIGIAITNKRLLGFSVITDQWTTVELAMNENPEEVIVEGNVATIRTNKRVIGFSAHTGQWVEAP